MNMKKLLCMALAALMAFVSFPIVARAAERTISAGGTYDIGDYYSAGDTLAIHTTGAVTLTNTGGITATNFQIVCDAGANLTIAGVAIDNSGYDGRCPLAFTGGGNTLTLAEGDASTLIGGGGQPGVRAETGTSLPIDGDGTLNATGGSLAAGIGGASGNGCGTILIIGGVVTAWGGVKDIGGDGGGGKLYVDGGASLTLSSMGTNAAVMLGDAKISDASGGIPDGYYVNGTRFTGTIHDVSTSGSMDITGQDLDPILFTGKKINACILIFNGTTFKAPIIFFNLDIEQMFLPAFTIYNQSSVELCGKNILSSGPGNAGLQCGPGSELTIMSAGTVPGSLTATGGVGGTGIGGQANDAAGTVSIEGGVFYASGGDGAQDIGRGSNGSGGSLSISGNARVFLRNNSSPLPTTATHHNVTATDFQGGPFYGLPVPWTGNFGAYLNLYAVTYDYQISGTPNGVRYADVNGLFTILDDAALAADGVIYPGHHLADWVCGGTHYTPGATGVVGADITLTAMWDPFTVKYNANNGSGSMADTSFNYGVPQALPANTFWRSGYDFAGWALSPGGAVKYADRQSVSDLTAANNGTVTLYACWSAQYYTITYTLDGGVATPANPAGYTVESGAITLTNPEKKGSAFSGWSGTGISGTAMSVTIPAGSMGSREYTAHWLLNGCTVKFDTGRGSAVADQSVLYGGKVKKPADPRREGCVFQGWYSDKAFTKPWNFDGDTVTTDITLYAKWKSTGVYTITAKASPTKGGQVTGAGRCAGGESVTLTAVPAGGYRFVSWTEGKKTVSANAAYVFISSKARTLTANFAKIGRPSIIKAKSAGHGSISLKWSAVKGVDGYYIYRARSRYGTYSRVASVTAESFTDVGLTAGKKYYYKVQAYCVAAGKTTVGKFSAVKSVKPTA